MKRLLLKSFLSPGDVLMLTAAVRDLHRSNPDTFVTDVRTSCPQLWENNPYLTELEEEDSEVEVIECHYPLIHKSNQAPYHFIHGFIEYLNERLDLKIRPTEFKGDIHLSSAEKFGSSPVAELVGEDTPYWVVTAGGKRDYTIKWWDTRRYQEVVNHFRGRIQFVQVGAAGHFHPELEGVIDLRGKTDIRKLIRLIYHADGVLCPITFLMHLTAAVEAKNDHGLRSCVVIAGGREPPHWESYPGHQFIHTVGILPCCKTGGCWKSRTLPLGDGSEHDRSPNLCVDVVGTLPRCMDMISSVEVIRRIEMYVDGKRIQDAAQIPTEKVEAAAAPVSSELTTGGKLNSGNARSAAEQFIKRIPSYPAGFEGRGIVICGGGTRYFTNAWICINMLRHLGCHLPIQLWYLGRNELDKRMESWLEPLGVECVDGLEVRKQHPARILNGWEIKPYSIIHSSFKEVLYLDADNVPIVNPEFLFETWHYKEAGALFWPDFGRLKATRSIWKVCGVVYRDEPEFESGQIVVNKQKCWHALCLTMWYNDQSDFFYQHIHGDKETFHMAFRKLNQPYAMPARPIHPLRGTMCQHDFDGRRIFQHRNLVKWDLFGKNKHVEGFRFEAECRGFLEELRRKWASGKDNAQILFSTVQEDTEQDTAAPDLEGPSGPDETMWQEKRFVIRARFDGYTGYGLHAQEIVKDLGRFGHDFGVVPIEAAQDPEAPIDSSVAKLFGSAYKNCKWELLLHPPNISPSSQVSTIYFTMWETTQLSNEGLKNIQQADAVIVPSEWNASCFSAQGIRSPIFICPLGVDPKLFRYHQMEGDDLCVFGTAGNLAISGRTRKGIDEAVAAFKSAFPIEQDVRLRIKTLSNDEVINFHDKRIELTQRCLTQAELADWYAGLTCYVSASKSEAWGLMQQQAMAVGRPVIGCHFGGMREFFDEEVGYCVAYSLKPADERYARLGLWAEPSKKSLVEQMRRVYENRKEVAEMGGKASARAHQFTWTSSSRRLEQILQEVGALQ